MITRLSKNSLRNFSKTSQRLDSSSSLRFAHFSKLTQENFQNHELSTVEEILYGAKQIGESFLPYLEPVIDTLGPAPAVFLFGFTTRIVPFLLVRLPLQRKARNDKIIVYNQIKNIFKSDDGNRDDQNKIDELSLRLATNTSIANKHNSWYQKNYKNAGPKSIKMVPILESELESLKTGNFLKSDYQFSKNFPDSHFFNDNTTNNKFLLYCQKEILIAGKISQQEFFIAPKSGHSNLPLNQVPEFLEPTGAKNASFVNLKLTPKNKNLIYAIFSSRFLKSESLENKNLNDQEVDFLKSHIKKLCGEESLNFKKSSRASQNIKPYPPDWAKDAENIKLLSTLNPDAKKTTAKKMLELLPYISLGVLCSLPFSSTILLGSFTGLLPTETAWFSLSREYQIFWIALITHFISVESIYFSKKHEITSGPGLGGSTPVEISGQLQLIRNELKKVPLDQLGDGDEIKSLKQKLKLGTPKSVKNQQRMVQSSVVMFTLMNFYFLLKFPIQFGTPICFLPYLAGIHCFGFVEKFFLANPKIRKSLKIDSPFDILTRREQLQKFKDYKEIYPHDRYKNLRSQYEKNNYVKTFAWYNFYSMVGFAFMAKYQINKKSKSEE